MSAIEHTNSAGSTKLDELPEFELTYRYDDDESPTEVTLFEDDSTTDRTTRWLTVSYADTVALELVR